MTTFKDLQNRTEEAEQIAKEASAKLEEAHAEVKDIKAKAEAFIMEAKSRIAASTLEATEARGLAEIAQKAAQPYAHERDQWWQRVFLTVLGTLADPSMPVRVKVAHAAGVASEAVQVRAGVLQNGGVPLNGGDSAQAQRTPKTSPKKTSKDLAPKSEETPDVPAANWLNTTES
jgi:ElaB/YqjD/DUF883 family membrane-anchored ribosome-binding protein